MRIKRRPSLVGGRLLPQVASTEAFAAEPGSYDVRSGFGALRVFLKNVNHEDENSIAFIFTS